MNKHYLCVVGISTDELDKKGNAKVNKSRYLVKATSFTEAVHNMNEYMKGTVADYDIVSLTESKFEDIVGVADKVVKFT